MTAFTGLFREDSQGPQAYMKKQLTRNSKKDPLWFILRGEFHRCSQGSLLCGKEGIENLSIC